MHRRYLNIAIVGLMAFLWVAQAAHCQIGAIPGLDCHTDASDGKAETEAHACCGGTCKTIESRQNRTEEKQLLAAPQPAPQPWLTIALVNLAWSDSDSHGGNSFADVPPELPQCWQFLSRTALPVRAPSSAS
jgi:hypothetical protein